MITEHGQRHTQGETLRTLCLITSLTLTAPAGAVVSESGDVLIDSFGIKLVGASGIGSIDVFGADPAATLPTAVLGDQPGSFGSITIREGSTVDVLALQFEAGEPPQQLEEHAFWVGFEGTGDFSVTEGSVVNGLRAFSIGARSSGEGTVTVDGAGSAVNLSGILAGAAPALAEGSLPAGSQAFIGVGTSGTGTMNVTNGAVVSLEPYEGQQPQPFSFGVFLGGDGTGQGGGHGTVNVAGPGSALNITGDNGLLVIGSFGGTGFNIPGDGTLNVTEGGQVTVSGGSNLVGIGSFIGTTGIATIDGVGSSIDGGVGIGVGTNYSEFDGDPGNDVPAGTGQLIVRNGAVAEAVVGVFIGADGILQGDGTIRGGVTAAAGGEVRPGNSPGVLTVIGNVDLSNGGTVELEIASESLFDQIFATGSFLLGGGEIRFVFLDGLDPMVLEMFDLGDLFQSIAFEGDTNPLAGSIDVNLFGADTLIFSGVSPGFDIDFIGFDAVNGFSVSASPIPLPPAFLLLGPAVLLLGVRSRRV